MISEIMIVTAKPTTITLISDEYEKIPSLPLISEIFYSIMGEEIGYGIKFSVTSDKFKVESIIILGCYSYSRNSTHQRKFKIEIRDANKRLIKSVTYTYSDYFNGFYAPLFDRIPDQSVKYVKVPLSVMVNTKIFYVIIYPNGENEDNCLWIASDAYLPPLQFEKHYPSKQHTYLFKNGKAVTRIKFNVVVRVKGYPVYTVKISSNLPEGLSITIRNETSTFGLKGGESLVIDAYNGSDLCVAQDFVYLNNVTRYVCINPQQTITGRQEIVFSFKPEYLVTIMVNPEDFYDYSTIRINARNYSKPFKEWFRNGSMAIIEAPMMIEEDGVRYIFDKFSLSSPSNRLTLTISSPLNVIVYYRRQYYVSVKSAHGKTEGEGWYDEGAYAIVSVNPSVVYDGDTRYVFTGWQSVGETKPSITIRVDKPLNIIALWSIEHRVKARSDFGIVRLSCDGVEKEGREVEIWARQGGKVSISITPLSQGLLVRKVFAGWIDQRGNEYRDPEIVLEVTNPIILTAKWRDDYTFLVLLIVVVMVAVAATVYIMVKKHGGLKETRPEREYAKHHKARVIAQRQSIPPDILKEIRQLKTLKEKILFFREKGYLEDKDYWRLVESYNTRINKLKEKLKELGIDIKAYDLEEI